MVIPPRSGGRRGGGGDGPGRGDGPDKGAGVGRGTGAGKGTGLDKGGGPGKPPTSPSGSMGRNTRGVTDSGAPVDRNAVRKINQDGDIWTKAKKPRGGSDGCYLTTACLEARGLSGDCYELALLRLFREEYVAKLPEGEAALAGYRDRAPRVVAAVEALGARRAREVWEEVYARGIAPAVELVRTGRWDEAYDHYRSLSAELERRFVAGSGNTAASPVPHDVPRHHDERSAHDET